MTYTHFLDCHVDESYRILLRIYGLPSFDRMVALQMDSMPQDVYPMPCLWHDLWPTPTMMPIQNLRMIYYCQTRSYRCAKLVPLSIRHSILMPTWRRLVLACATFALVARRGQDWSRRNLCQNWPLH